MNFNKLPILSPLLSLVSRSVIKSQSGITPIFILLLLLVGIAGGTFLVQQRTNLMPFAATNSKPATPEYRDQYCGNGNSPRQCPDGEFTCLSGVIEGDAVSNACKNKANSVFLCEAGFVKTDDYKCVRYSCPDGGDLIGQSCFTKTVDNECPRPGDITTVCTEGRVYSYECQGTLDGNKKIARPSLTRDAQPGDSCYLGTSQPLQPKCSINLNGKKYEHSIGGGFISDCTAVEGYSKGRRTLYTCQNPPIYTPGASDDCDLIQSGDPNRKELTYSCDNNRIVSSVGDTGQVSIIRECSKNETCEIVGGNVTCKENPNTGVQPSPGNSSGGGAVVTVTPTDGPSCVVATACVFSEGNVCKVGLCKDGATNCGFNVECSFQTALDKQCISGSEYEINGKKYRPGATIDCNLKNQAGTSARAAAGGSSGGTGSAPAYVEPPTDDEKAADNFKKCGFNTEVDGIPIYGISFGQNEQFEDPDCQKLKDAQISYFYRKIDEAKQRAEEAAKKAGFKIVDGVFVVDEENPLNKDKSEEQINTERKKLEESYAAAVKKATEAKKEVEKCEDKDKEELSKCLAGTKKQVEEVASATQVAALKSYVEKYEAILNGAPSKCVKADLGVAPHLEAKRLKARGGTTAGSADDLDKRNFFRMLLCSGKNSSKDKLDLKWRVLTGGADNTEDDESGNGNAERIFELHGTDEKAKDVPPKYPFDVRNGPTLTGQTKEAVEAALKPWVDAARGGKLRIAGEPNQRGENSIRDRVSSGSASRSSGTGPTGGNPASPATETSSIPEYSSEQKQQAAISRQGTKSCDGNFVLVDGSKSKGFDCAGNNRGWVCGKVKGGGNDTIGCFKP